ncbi:MAG: hypothetical protein WBA16_00300 [Nonlabens sp.]
MNSFKIKLVVAACGFILLGSFFIWFFQYDLSYTYKTNDHIIWSRDVQIEPGDYIGSPPQGSTARSSAFIGMTLISGKLNKLRAEAYFDRSQSWIKDTTHFDFKTDLAIDKLVFDIFQLHAAEFNKYIDSTSNFREISFKERVLVGDSIYSKAATVRKEAESIKTLESEMYTKLRAKVDAAINE